MEDKFVTTSSEQIAIANIMKKLTGKADAIVRGTTTEETGSTSEKCIYFNSEKKTLGSAPFVFSSPAAAFYELEKVSREAGFVYAVAQITNNAELLEAKYETQRRTR